MSARVKFILCVFLIAVSACQYVNLDRTNIPYMDIKPSSDQATFEKLFYQNLIRKLNFNQNADSNGKDERWSLDYIASVSKRNLGALFFDSSSHILLEGRATVTVFCNDKEIFEFSNIADADVKNTRDIEINNLATEKAYQQLSNLLSEKSLIRINSYFTKNTDFAELCG